MLKFVPGRGGLVMQSECWLLIVRMFLLPGEHDHPDSLELFQPASSPSIRRENLMFFYVPGEDTNSVRCQYAHRAHARHCGVRGSTCPEIEAMGGPLWLWLLALHQGGWISLASPFEVCLPELCRPILRSQAKLAAALALV